MHLNIPTRSLISLACALAWFLTGCTRDSGNAGYVISDSAAIKDFSHPDFFPVSVWYSGGKARAPMQSAITESSREEWKKDLEQIKGLGFNTVRTWVEWTHTEPREGEYDLRNLELLCELANEVGLKVFIQMYGESAPDWVGKKYPDALLEAQSGDKVKPQSAPGYCVDHPGVREAFSQFYTETAKIAGSYPNFYGWDLWSEPHMVQWGGPRWIPNVQYCFCPYTQQRFREWLKNKYSTIELLNQAWYRTFLDWDEVEPPRFNTILSYTDFIDWKNFIYQKMAEDMRLRYDAVRKADRNGVITSHSSPVSVFSSPHGSGAEDDFLFADQVDFYGISQYPKHNQPGDWIRWTFMTNADFSYSANIRNGGYYVGEFQSGFGTVGMRVGDEVTAADQLIWLWTSLATGARAVNVYAYYPMNSGYESGGYGLINLDGTITERAVALGKLASFVDANKNLILSSRPVRAEVALVYNPLAQMIGGEGETGGRGAGHTRSLIGYYRVLTAYNIPVEFIHRRDLEGSDLSHYKLIIIPFPVMFTEKAAEGLKTFIRNGGYAVSEARLAWNDDRGYATDIIPGMGLSEVFGIRESKVEVKENVDMRIADRVHPALSGFKLGDNLRGLHFAESVVPLPGQGARALAKLSDGSAVLTTSHYGDGETLYIGSFLNNHPDFDDNNTRFILGMIDWAGIKRPFTSSHDGRTENPVVIRLHENPDGQLLYILNQGKTAEKITINLSVAGSGEHLLREIINGRELKLSPVQGIITFTTNEIGGSNVEVWEIK
ncbi:MAG TPA: beta-galactosidase [Cyclobacteriaceae bacterium]|nr:beta-galactosidase [Cyclobacteriaceae bacterium]